MKDRAMVANIQPTESEHAVVARGVTKEFGSGDTGTLALRGVDLDIAYGETTLLVGPSGCGKTTLISIIAGLLNPTGGQVTVLGEDLTRLRNGGLVRFRQRHIGFVFQQYNLLPALTAAENAAIPLVIAGRPRRVAVQPGRAVIVVTHDNRVFGFGDRIVSMSDGRVERVEERRGNQ